MLKERTQTGKTREGVMNTIVFQLIKNAKLYAREQKIKILLSRPRLRAI